MFQQFALSLLLTFGVGAGAALAVGCGQDKASSESESRVVNVGGHDRQTTRIADRGEQNIVEIASEAGSFSTLLRAASAAGLAETLAEDGPFTVFAPTDEAFAAVPGDTLEALLREENREALRTVLLYHVVSGRVNASDAISAGSADTLIQQGVGFSIRDGRLFVNDSGVVANDIRASNGVIHVIDAVLIPENLRLAPQGRLVIGFVPGSVGAALARQIGVDGDEAILVNSVTRGSEAQKAGLQRFDVIVEINGRPATRENLARAKREAGAGGTVALVVFSQGERVHIDTKVGVDSN